MRLVVISHVTLDGVMQSNGKPEPELNDGFDQGGWQVPYFDEDMSRLATAWIAAADAFLLGRRTYELFADHWSRVTDPDDPFATRLNGLPKHVVSARLDRVDWRSSTLVRGDLQEAVATLKLRPGNELQVYGSASLIQSLMEYDLTDEFRVLIHLVVLGNGRRLFAERTTPTALQLVDTKITRRSVVAHVYRPSGKPQYGFAELIEDGGVTKDSVGRKLAR